MLTFLKIFWSLCNVPFVKLISFVMSVHLFFMLVQVNWCSVALLGPLVAGAMEDN